MNVILVCVGEVNGVRAYAPLDRKDEEAIGNKARQKAAQNGTARLMHLSNRTELGDMVK